MKSTGCIEVPGKGLPLANGAQHIVDGVHHEIAECNACQVDESIV